MKIFSPVVAVVVLLAPLPARAWNNFGHMEVAAVAYDHLDPAVRERVNALIRLNPNYGDLIEGVRPRSYDKIAFMRAATWADLIKSEQGYVDDDVSGPDAARNIGYADKFRHKYWHYTDIPFSPDGTPLKQPDEPNAQTEIALLRAALGSNASDDIKSYDLVWLLHLVGDVHQPLHATSRFTQAGPDGDQGGNKVPVCKGTVADCDNPDKLHAYWDGVLGSSNNSVKALQAAANLPPPDAAKAAIAGEQEWIEESFEIAKDVVYSGPIEVGAGPFLLTNSYKNAAVRVAKERAALAGVRLANLINSSLK